MTAIKKRNLVVIAVIILVVAIVVSSFIYLNFQKPYSGNVESISIGTIPLKTNSLIYIANNENYFAANGLNVTFKNYGSGAQAMQGMLNGEVNIAVASEFVVVEAAVASPGFYVFGSVSKFNIYNVVARTDKGISNISDLTGKTIGAAFGTIGQYYLGSFLNQNNINPSDVTIVNVPNAQSASALENGTVDAIVTYQPNISQIESLLGKNTVIWPAQANQLGYFDAACSTSFATTHSDLIVRFLTALVQAQNFNINHEAQAKTIVAEALNETSSYIQSVWSNYQFKVSLDQSQISAMQEETQWLINNNLTATTQIPNFLNYIYINGLKTVNPNLINIAG